MGDEELRRICAEIYAKHRQALDLIYENKPDNSHKLAEYIKSWLKKKKEEIQIIYPYNNGDNWIKFKSRLLASTLPDKTDNEPEWESGLSKYVFYEFRNTKGQKLELYLAFNLKTIPEKYREISNVFMECSDKKGMAAEQERVFPFTTKRNDFSEYLSEEDTHILLDEMYAELEKYERRVKDKLSNCG